jgi:hypothetical protein
VLLKEIFISTYIALLLYAEEQQIFSLMDAFCVESNLQRTSDKHREIYVNDARKTPVEKLKTVLRYILKQKRKYE